MDHPVVSIIVPVYNVQDYLKDCIESIRSQTYQNYELILVDDGSTDNSPEICDYYVEKDKRIHVIHQKNQGQSAARNHALGMARGEWICFVDSDDLIHPQMLEFLYNAALQSNMAMSMCGYVEADAVPADFFAPCDFQYQTLILNEETLADLYEKNEYPSWVVWFKLIRKDIVMRFPFAEGRIYEDNAVVCKWVYAAGIVAKIPFNMYFYRVNPRGTTKSEFSLKKLDYLWALREIIDFFADIRYEKLQAIFCETYIVTAAGFYRIVAEKLDRKDIARQIRWDLTCVFIPNRKKLKFTKAQYAEVIGNVYPNILPVYWLADGTISTIKHEGIGALMKKIVKHLR